VLEERSGIGQPHAAEVWLTLRSCQKSRPADGRSDSLTKESPRARAATPGKPTTSSRSGKRHRSLTPSPSAFITTTSTWPTISPPSSVPSRTRCAFLIVSNYALNLRLTSSLTGQLLLLLQNWRMPSRRPLLAQTCQTLILANHPPPQPLPKSRIRPQGQHEPSTTAEPL
jgi:hypothetical protein